MLAVLVLQIWCFHATQELSSNCELSCGYCATGMVPSEGMPPMSGWPPANRVFCMLAQGDKVWMERLEAVQQKGEFVPAEKAVRRAEGPASPVTRVSLPLLGSSWLICL